MTKGCLCLFVAPISTIPLPFLSSHDMEQELHEWLGVTTAKTTGKPVYPRLSLREKRGAICGLGKTWISSSRKFLSS